MFVKQILDAVCAAVLVSSSAAAGPIVSQSMHPNQPAALSETGSNAVIASPVGSAFTYQGLLRSSGAIAQGAHDFTFRLYDDVNAGTQIGAAQTTLGVAVDNGFFSVALDFGSSAFDGNARWLDIQVRVAGGASYTQLLPRQPLRAAPYAVRSMNGGSSQWSNDASGIGYGGRVGVGGASHPGSQLVVDNGTNNSQGLSVVSANGPWAALVVRNHGTDGWGIYDNVSKNHEVTGEFGFGRAPEYPVDIENTVGAGLRVVSYGANVPYPGEGVRAAMFVHGHTGGGALGRDTNGLFASSTDARAVSGWSQNNWGVDGNCVSSGTYGVLGTPNEGVFGFSPSTTKPAGKFMAPANGIAIEALGLAKVKTLQITGGADLAEPFDVTATSRGPVEPGTVVVIDETSSGRMKVSDRAYDTRVAGVVSGANGLAPGMVMQSDEMRQGGGEHPVALTGRVWCKVDASFGAVNAGDLLVSSPTPGHAMAATDAARRSGAVLGKAMTSLEAGRGLVLVLVSLQ